MGNLSFHHRMNRQGDDRQRSAAEDGKNGKSFGEHGVEVGVKPTLLNSAQIPDDAAQAMA